VGTEVPVEAEKLATELLERFPKAMVVAGQLIFDEDTMRGTGSSTTRRRS
jgi:hypothetical protein